MMSGQQTIAATPVGRREPNVSPVVPRESERVRLARVALTAALGVPGVQGADAGPGDVAVTGTALGARLEGVTCVAAPTGGYDVSLRLGAPEQVSLGRLPCRVLPPSKGIPLWEAS